MDIQYLAIIIPAIAVLIAPFLSYWGIRKFDNNKKAQDIKDQCFFNLYSYRGQPASHQFVTAFNSVPLIFKGDEKIISKWRALVQHYYDESKHKASEDIWCNEAATKRYELIEEISKKTSYSNLYGINDLKNDTYVPKQVAINDALGMAVPFNLDRIATALEKILDKANDVPKS